MFIETERNVAHELLAYSQLARQTRSNQPVLLLKMLLLMKMMVIMMTMTLTLLLLLMATPLDPSDEQFCRTGIEGQHSVMKRTSISFETLTSSSCGWVEP